MMKIDDLLVAFMSWDFAQGGPFNSHDRAERCMKQAANEIKRLRKVSRDQAGVELSEENDRLIDENKRLTAALEIARTALLRIERGCEDGRAALTHAYEQSAGAKNGA